MSKNSQRSSLLKRGRLFFFGQNISWGRLLSRGRLLFCQDECWNTDPLSCLLLLQKVALAHWYFCIISTSQFGRISLVLWREYSKIERYSFSNMPLFGNTIFSYIFWLNIIDFRRSGSEVIIVKLEVAYQFIWGLDQRSLLLKRGRLLIFEKKELEVVYYHEVVY